MKSKYTKEQYEEVFRLHAQGLGNRKISKIMGINRQVIMSYLSGKRKPPAAWTEEDYARWKANIFTEETRKNMSIAHTGILHTEEAKEKIRVAKIGEKNPMWKGDNVGKDEGRKRARQRYKTPENKEIHHIDGNPLNNDPSNIMIVTRREHMEEDGRLDNLIKRNKGEYSEETRRKMSEAAKGRKHRPESIQKMREVHRGQPVSPEARKKIGEAKKKYWEEWRRRKTLNPQ